MAKHGSGTGNSTVFGLVSRGAAALRGSGLLRAAGGGDHRIFDRRISLWAVAGGRFDLPHRRRLGAGPGANVAAADLGAHAVGDAGGDATPRLGGAGGLRRDPDVRRLVSRSAHAGAGAAVPDLRAFVDDVPDRAVGAVHQHVQPAGRYQEPHDSHRGDQAGAGGRNHSGPHPGFHADRHRLAGGDGRVQLRVCGAFAGSHPRSAS